MSYTKALCPSVFICARMYAVKQGFVTSEAKGAHVGRRYPTMQILLKKFFTMYEADLLKQSLTKAGTAPALACILMNRFELYLCLHFVP